MANFATYPWGHGDVTPERPAFRCGADVWTYGRVRDTMARVAGAVRSRGVGPGHRALLVAPTVPEFAVASYARRRDRRHHPLPLCAKAGRLLGADPNDQAVRTKLAHRPAVEGRAATLRWAAVEAAQQAPGTSSPSTSRSSQAAPPHDAQRFGLGKLPHSSGPQRPTNDLRSRDSCNTTTGADQAPKETSPTTCPTTTPRENFTTALDNNYNFKQTNGSSDAPISQKSMASSTRYGASRPSPPNQRRKSSPNCSRHNGRDPITDEHERNQSETRGAAPEAC